MAKLKARIPGGGGGAPPKKKKRSEFEILKGLYQAAIGATRGLPSPKLPSQRKAEKEAKAAAKEVARMKRKAKKRK